MKNVFNVSDYGAVADGKSICTQAFQQAIDDAEKCQGEVFVPSGEYLCEKIKLKPHVKLCGINTRSYRNNGGSVLVPADKTAPCLIDITNAYGCVVQDICLDGKSLGNCVHGIATLRQDDEQLFQEDTPIFDNIKVTAFSGDGLHLQRIWCFSVRHSMFYKNHGNGLYIKGWDGFIVDNWFSFNGGAGVLSDKEISAVIFNANRVEWNAVAGFKFINPIGITISGNAFDASGGPAIDLNNPVGTRSINVTVVGNNFSRSGMSTIRTKTSGPSCHLHIERAINVLVQSNSFYHGFDDEGNRATLCPQTGIIIGRLSDCIIKDNLLNRCATENVCLDNGNHKGNNDIQIIGSTNASVGEYLFPFWEE